jgi:putative hydrolase of HD superfamily
VKSERLRKQFDFIVEIDKVKNVIRQTLLMHDGRNENDAEHSWHIAVMAVVLSEYARGKKIDVLRVIKMLLIHDLVEIDAGDTYIYDAEGNRDKRERENAAAERIFNLLPEDLADEFHRLWCEFEERESPEAKFAASLDRLQPLIHNYVTEGKAWKSHDINSSQVLHVNSRIQEGSMDLWHFAEELINESIQKGYLEE